MARKKTTTVTEEETPYEEIHNKTMEELAADKEATVEDAPIEEESPAKKVDAVKEEEIEFDPEQLKKEAAEQAANQILERLTGKKEDKDETDQELVSPWAKEGRNPKDYEEIADWGIAKKAILDERHAKEVEAQTTRERENQAKATEANEQAFLKFVDTELEELYTMGQLPKIKNNQDPRDAGVMATNELLSTMARVNNERSQRGEAPIYSINKIFHNHYRSSNAQPAGADAPVSGNRGARASDADDDRYVYARDHKKSMRQLGNS